MKLRYYFTKYYPLIAILVTAAILRLNHINQPFVDYISWRQSDTATIADNFYQGNWNILYPRISWNGAEPNYVGYEFQTVTYIAALLYVLVGQHDWVGRSVAVVFGLWGIFALYQLVRRVWGEKYAVASAAIMALLPGSIFIERSFLPDPVMVSLVVTSFWLLVAYLQTERLHYLVLASLIGTWGFLTKISGLLVGIPMLYAILTILAHRHKLRSKQLALVSFAAVLTLVPVVAYYLWAKHISLTYPPYHIASAGNWLWNDGLALWLSQKYFLSGMLRGHINWLWTWPVVVLVLFGLLFPACKVRSNQKLVSDQLNKGSSCKLPWLFHWWILSGLIFYLIGAKELVNNSWNFHIINPAIAALTGYAIVSIASLTTQISRSFAITVITLILVVIILSGSTGLRQMYYPRANESYKLGLALNQVAQPNDLVLTIANFIGDPVAIYYSKRYGWVFPPAWLGVGWWQQKIEDDNKAIRLFEELRVQGADWLGIVNEQKNKLWKNNYKLVKYIEHTCELHQESSEWVIYHILPQKNVQS